jgi:tape measure domain-containing protein
MLGSGQKSKAFLDQLQTFAKTTPFEFGALVHNAQNMMGMGIAAKSVIPDLRALGDSVASIGGSAQQVDSVTLAFDQMNAKGTLDMGNMNQLMQNGVPSALKILASSYGVTTGAMIKMISTGKIQSSEALPKLIAGIEKGTASTAALGGMMDKQSQTFSGAMSNISDSMTQALAGAFRPFFGIVSTGAQKVATWLGSPTFTTFGAKVSAGLSSAITAGKKFITGFNFHPILSALTSVWSVITKDLVPAAKDLATTFGPLVVTIGKDLFGAVGNLGSVLGPVGSTVKDVFGFMASHKTTFQAIGVAIGVVVGYLKLMALQEAIVKGITAAWIPIQLAMDAAMDANPIGLVVIALVGLAAGIAYLWTHSAGFRNFFIGIWNDIWGFLKVIGGWFAGPFKDFFVGAWNIISGAALWLWHNVLDPMWQGITGGIKFVMNIVTSLINLWLYFANMVFQPMWQGVIKPVIGAIAAAIVWLWKAMVVPMVAGVETAVKALGAVFTWLWRNAIEPAFHGVSALASWLWHNVLDPTWSGIKKALTVVGDAFKTVFTSVRDHVSSIFKDIVGAIKGAVNAVIDVINGAIGGVDGVISKANKVPGVNLPMIPKIPHLAAGGIVRARPGGVLALLGEGGRDERVTPLGRGGASLGGGGTIHVDVHLHGGAVNASVREVQAYVREQFAGEVVAALQGHA